MAEKKNVVSTTKNVTKVTENTETKDNTVITVEYETPKGYNTVDAIIWYQDNCLVGAPTIDGELREDLMVGGVNEADVKAGIAAELKMIEMADGNVMKGMLNLMTSMRTTLHGIKPSEQVDVQGLPMMIDYQKKAIYLINGTEVANLDDVEGTASNEFIKAMLVDRANTWISDNGLDEDEWDEDIYDDEEDY